MNKSKIEWTNYTANPVKGLCPVGCSYCYARRLYERFHWDPTIRYDPDWWRDIATLREPARIFVGSTMELFSVWVPWEWIDQIVEYCRRMPQHTFIFLTKRPRRLPVHWPDNCWVGITATNEAEFGNATNAFFRHRVAKTQFISIEPLLSWDTSHWVYPLSSSVSRGDIDWLIIGQQTPVRWSTTPKIEWITEIVDAADNAGIPVFLKDNLDCLIGQDKRFKRYKGRDAEGNMLVGLRQEFPEHRMTGEGCLPGDVLE